MHETERFNVIRPDLTTLRVFLSVCNLGNISKAAAREHITPSAVSKRIQALEAEIGTGLFYRSVKGVAMTPAGESLARHAAKIFDDIHGMAVDLSAFTSGRKGQVRIHTHTSAVLQFLSTELSQFSRMYPDVRILLREEISSDVLQSIVDGFADIGILPRHMNIPGSLDVFPYRSDRLAALVPSNHPLAAKDVIDFTEIGNSSFISMEHGSSLQMLLASVAEKAGFDINIRMEVRTFESAKCMVEAGLGLTVLPVGVVGAVAGLAKWIGISNEWAVRQHVICVNHKASLTASVNLMLRHLQPQAPQSTPEGIFLPR